jgi:5-methyltetrahydropteroyltriglutamate--homocysteine methyltransferase
LPEADFHAAADDAVRLAAAGQIRAGADVLTDGEQRRDNYASFVGRLLDNCQLVPIADLAAYVDDPEKFAAELRALEVPAHEVRHPAVFGKLGRRQPLAVGEVEFLRTVTELPVKVALPGPYLLTRTMWMECLSDRAYDTRETLAADVVAVLREELADLLAAGAALVQFDEPVLTEAAFARRAGEQRTFMCGALGEKRPVAEELAFAQGLLQDVLAGFPQARTAIHLCRGNWSKNEAVALAGDYRPLVPLLSAIPVGHYFLELCTPRAGELEVLADLPDDRRIGVGVVNQKLDEIDAVDAVLERGRRAVNLFGAERVTFNPDCGFATFADAPLASADAAERKLRIIRQAADRLRADFRA